MSYIKSLTTEMDGKHITCKIENTVISDARIVFEEDNYYIVQNLKNGSDCNEKLGYKYSWVVSDGTPYAIETNSVTNIQLLNSDYEIY